MRHRAPRRLPNLIHALGRLRPGRGWYVYALASAVIVAAGGFVAAVGWFDRGAQEAQAAAPGAAQESLGSSGLAPTSGTTTDRGELRPSRQSPARASVGTPSASQSPQLDKGLSSRSSSGPGAGDATSGGMARSGADAPKPSSTGGSAQGGSGSQPVGAEPTPKPAPSPTPGSGDSNDGGSGDNGGSDKPKGNKPEDKPKGKPENGGGGKGGDSGGDDGGDDDNGGGGGDDSILPSPIGDLLPSPLK